MPSGNLTNLLLGCLIGTVLLETVALTLTSLTLRGLIREIAYLSRLVTEVRLRLPAPSSIVGPPADRPPS